MKNVLQINNLVVAFETGQGDLTAVKGISLELGRGETLALVGESGCGKTVLCKSIMNLLCEKGRVREGEILLGDRDLLCVKNKKAEEYRGRTVAMVFQDPMTALDPTMSVGQQIAEVLVVHGQMEKKQAYNKAVELMELVEIDNTQARYKQMPHQFSGGMRQRIAVAIALAGSPQVLLADEPTTALDETTRNQILALLKKIQRETGVATIFITHDLSLVEEIADRVAIMQDGSIVETGIVEEVFASPHHSYTKKLLGYLDYKKKKGHTHKRERELQEPIVSIRDVNKSFVIGKNLPVHVLRNLSMDIYRGEILGLVGQSGCGKSTLARCIMGMERPNSGTIKNFGQMQMIFQDSNSAFNPRMTIEKIIGEPLRIARGKAPDREQIALLMRQVELDPRLMDRRPYEISGGQRQRAAIARAISVDPELIIADEPLSSLDVSTQAQIIHLFRALQEKRNLTILLIAHDLPMVNHISDRVISL